MGIQELALIVLLLAFMVIPSLMFKIKRERRRKYYHEVYLMSDEWKRKRYLVLKRDNWQCVYCGAPATQVHHKRYARKNIGKEPIEWLVSVCDACHESRHSSIYDDLKKQMNHRK